MDFNNCTIDELIDLFNFVPEIQFWIKDKTFRYITVNKGFLDNYSLQSLQDIIGKTDFDISPYYIAEQFRSDDLKVIKGKSVVNRVELVVANELTLNWYITNKRPLYSKGKTIIGTCGITQPLKKSNKLISHIVELEETILFIHNNINRNIQNKELAIIANRSLSAFERKFHKVFNMSPQQYIKKYRVQQAAKLLINSTNNLIDIAFKTGFSDQSHLIREFKKIIGKTPHQYRNAMHNKIVESSW